MNIYWRVWLRRNNVWVTTSYGGSTKEAALKDIERLKRAFPSMVYKAQKEVK